MRKIMGFLLINLVPFSAHAATCAIGYWLNTETGECEKCIPGLTFDYCIGDDNRYECPKLYEQEYLSHFRRYYTWSSKSTTQELGSCRIVLHNYPIEHGSLCFSVGFYASKLLSHYGIDYRAAGYSSANEYFRLNWNPDDSSDYGYMAPNNTYQAEYSMSYCDAGYYGFRGRSNYQFPSYAQLFAYEHCRVVGHGYWSPAKTWERTKCPIGTYTDTTTSAATTDCIPCTNAPAHATYTDTDTTGVNTCPWECDAGYGRTDDDTCAELCTAGMTEFRSSNGISLNIYANKKTTPSLHLFKNGTTCYVNLAPDTATDTINIQYNNSGFHATN